MAFQCSFSAVEAILAGMNFIADPHRSAFASRIKNIQRLKFPSGINTGRGVAAIYRAEHVLLLGLTIELLQLGLTPERAVRTLSNNSRTIMQAFCDELLAESQEAKGYDFTGPRQTFLGFDPEAMQELAKQPEGLETVEDIASFTFIYGGVDTLTHWLQNPFPNQGIRLAVIPLTRFMQRLLSHVSHSLGSDQHNEFALALAEWAASGLQDRPL